VTVTRIRDVSVGVLGLSNGGVEAVTRTRCISFYFYEAVHVCRVLSYLMEELRPSQGSDV